MNYDAKSLLLFEVCYTSQFEAEAHVSKYTPL